MTVKILATKILVQVSTWVWEIFLETVVAFF